MTQKLFGDHFIHFSLQPSKEIDIIAHFTDEVEFFFQVTHW